MTVDLFAYHLGIVVRDLDAACARYSEYLSVPRWHFTEIERPGLPTNPATAGGRGRQRIAFGRVPGATFELIQPVKGKSVFSVYLEERGEGLQHLGVWTPDLSAAVTDAIAKGGRVTHASLKEGMATVQLTPSSPPDAIVPALDNIAYIDPGFGGFQIEFVGSANPERMRRIMGDDFDDIITLPPWYKPNERGVPA
jgi:catechol 2,3-dioxygenase-like lactoylglutathione lyase family enzyme